MSQKPEATYHGADIVDRLDVIAPHSEDGRLLQEAATTIRDLRAKVIVADDETVERVARALFREEQCDQRQAADLEENWQRRLSERDQEEYRVLARAALTEANQ